MRRAFLILIFITSLTTARKVVVKMATLAPQGTDVHGMLMEVGQEWKKITKGKVHLKIYPGGVVGDERDMVRKIRIGQIHAAAMTSEGLSEITPEFAGFFIPLAFQSYEHIEKVKKSLLPELKSKMNKNGFELLSLNDFGWVHWFSKELIKTPNDLKDQKFFTWAGDFRWEEIWIKAGYSPVPLASTDILTGLQTGLINTIPTMPIYALTQQSFGIANNMLDLKWGVVMAGIIFDSRVWNRIPSKYHNEMISILDKILLKNQLKGRESEEKAIMVMVQNGLKIHKPTKKEINIWLEEVNKFQPLLKGKVIPNKVYDRVMDLIKN
jgi:TRAP-type C4-dicarboxylate transport system substrate-binding protein